MKLIIYFKNMKYINDEQRDFIVKARGDRHKFLLEQLRGDIYGA